MMDHERIARLLEQAFESARGSMIEDYEKQKWEFVFHMTDWYDDLVQLHEMFSAPERWNADTACEFLIGFLAHVTPHLNVAAKLIAGDIPNTE